MTTRYRTFCHGDREMQNGGGQDARATVAPGILPGAIFFQPIC